VRRSFDVTSSVKARTDPNRRIRRSTAALACWNDRSKYGTTPGVEVITSIKDSRISAGCR
jgi:hypothetical protein